MGDRGKSDYRKRGSSRSEGKTSHCQQQISGKALVAQIQRHESNVNGKMRERKNSRFVNQRLSFSTWLRLGFTFGIALASLNLFHGRTVGKDEFNSLSRRQLDEGIPILNNYITSSTLIQVNNTSVSDGNEQRPEEDLKTCVITITSWNKYGVVRTLFDTVKESNPQIGCFIWYVADDGVFPPEARAVKKVNQTDIRSATQQLFPPVTAGDMAAKLNEYSIKQAAFLLSADEFVAALKPFAFKYTFHVHGASSAIYLDPDIWVGGLLSEFNDRLMKKSGVFVQYTTKMTSEGSDDGNGGEHLTSSFDVGVVALSHTRSSLDALDRWVLHCQRCFVLSEDNTFQVAKECRYSFVSAIFEDSNDYYLIRDSKYMVLSWNLSETCAGLHLKDGRLYYLDALTQKDHPVSLFHFSGMSISDTGCHRAIITQDNTQYSAIDSPKSCEVFDAYMERLTKYSALEYRAIPYGFQHFANSSIEIEPWIRLRYADMIYVNPQKVEKDPKLLPDYRSPYNIVQQPRPRVSKALFHEWVHPDPFCPSLGKCQGSDRTAKYKLTYLEWLSSGPHHMSVNMEGRFYYSETMHSVWERRQDLQKDFPDPTGVNYKEYMDWFAMKAWKEGMVSTGMFRHWREIQDYHKSHHEAFHRNVTSMSEIGVNIFGWHLAVFGLAQAAVNVVKAVRSVDGDVAAIHQKEVYRKTHFRPESLPFPLSRSSSEAVNFLVVNPNLAGFIEKMIPNDVLQNKYNIAWWFWELDRLPRQWMSALANYDEVWLPSQFVLDAVLQSPGYDGTPLKLLPIPVELQDTSTPVDTRVRAESTAFQVPADAFLFLVTFDFESFLERKNPMAAILAFRSAFPIAENPSHTRQLIVKSSGGSPEQHDELKNIAGGDPRIQFITSTLPEQELRALQRRADCYVSLHRSEGYALNIVEAMLSGVPVIATNYSGNVGFFEPLQEFMGTCQFAVPYELVKLTQNHGLYKKGNRWAEADQDFAVNAMKAVVQNNCKSQHGPKMAQAVADQFGLKAVGKKFQDLLAQSYPLIVAKQQRTSAHLG